ncbi:MAG TPA: acyl-CoA dehydrogenase family protein, partial [Myxococcota bacterium]|nr:acyl-CoA dehydrogenase family protein [Myxococcota bacterium]
MAAGCCGTAHSALHKTLDHVATRTQFGRTLASQPIVQDQLRWMSARLSAMRALVDQAAAAADANSPALEPLSLAAKVFASDGDWQICDLAVQLHGGS